MTKITEPLIRHPRPDSRGNHRVINTPSTPTDLAAWNDPSRIATVIPDGPMPAQVNKLAIHSWQESPLDDADWGELVDDCKFDEPAFKVESGFWPASGAVVIEPDYRVWVVSPSNQFLDYVHTFPKGSLETDSDPRSLRINALREVFEESGLKVSLVGFLADSIRTASVTRYYLARRTGGNPADMCWESQAVNLVPLGNVDKFVNREVDQLIARKLQKLDLRGLFGDGFFTN